MKIIFPDFRAQGYRFTSRLSSSNLFFTSLRGALRTTFPIGAIALLAACAAPPEPVLSADAAAALYPEPSIALWARTCGAYFTDFDGLRVAMRKAAYPENLPFEVSMLLGDPGTAWDTTTERSQMALTLLANNSDCEVHVQRANVEAARQEFDLSMRRLSDRGFKVVQTTDAMDRGNRKIGYLVSSTPKIRWTFMISLLDDPTAISQLRMGVIRVGAQDWTLNNGLKALESRTSN